MNEPRLRELLSAALRLDRMRLLPGMRRIVLVPDEDQWNAGYAPGLDEIELQAKFLRKPQADQIRIILHEGGHRGQFKVIPKAFAYFKELGLVRKSYFMQIANKEHLEDFTTTGKVDGADGEIFAESYARYCLNMDMPGPLRAFWESRYAKCQRL